VSILQNNIIVFDVVILKANIIQPYFLALSGDRRIVTVDVVRDLHKSSFSAYIQKYHSVSSKSNLVTYGRNDGSAKNVSLSIES
jgi:hypothetical protein